MKKYLKINYRPEIDGLRAIAVLFVFFYHLDIDFFKFGYLGVDIFFVISGYLITSLLLKNINQKSFFLSFYLRRARRLIPALIVVLLFTSFITFLYYIPYDLRDFGQSLLATITFLSNVLFFIESGYFENLSKVKPLLHTWSLSVEEQFYLFFPLLIFLIYVKKKASKNIIVLFFISSLMLANFSGFLLERSDNIIHNSFFLNQSVFFGFYSPFGRFWEFLLGSMIVVYNLEAKSFNFKRLKISSDFFSFIGIFLIISILIVPQKNIISPSFQSLVPLLGVVLILVFSKENNFISSIISNKLFTFIGKISYSIYLYHFPIVVFIKYNNF